MAYSCTLRVATCRAIEPSGNVAESSRSVDLNLASTYAQYTAESQVGNCLAVTILN